MIISMIEGIKHIPLGPLFSIERLSKLVRQSLFYVFKPSKRCETHRITPSVFTNILTIDECDLSM